MDGIATANADEAIEIRTAGVRLPILMYASNLPAATRRLLAHGLTPTIADRAGLEAAAAAAGGQPVAVHVEVDSGFGRLGVRFDEAASFIATVVAEPRVHLEGIYTHVPFSDRNGVIWAGRRVAAFGELVHQIEATHAGSSVADCRKPVMSNWVLDGRVGTTAAAPALPGPSFINIVMVPAKASVAKSAPYTRARPENDRSRS